MKHSNVVLYAYSKDDLEKLIQVVIEKVRRNELISDIDVTPEDDRLTQNEAAAFLGISVQSLIKWKKNGTVPYYQINRSIFYSKKELLNLARNNHKLGRVPRD